LVIPEGREDLARLVDVEAACWFEVTDTLDEMFGWLDRELMVPLAGRPALGFEGGPIVHSFNPARSIDSGEEMC